MIEISLLGRFEIRSGRHVIPGLDSGKVGELLGWLLLHRDRWLVREELATLLWPEAPPERVRKNFSQTLWRLKSGLEIGLGLELEDLLVQRQNRLRCEPGAGLELDVARLESVLTHSAGVRGRSFTAAWAEQVTAAVALYQGDLLPGWYQDWCGTERTRLRAGYLELLDKLMDYQEQTGAYETGIETGHRSLGHEPACERTHRRLMRLYTLAGNRTAALRQYAHCQRVLAADLNLQPDGLTRELARQIREGVFDPGLPATESGAYPLPIQSAPTPESATLPVSPAKKNRRPRGQLTLHKAV